jgi:hypothetical protein
MNMIADITGMMRPLSVMASNAKLVMSEPLSEALLKADAGIADFVVETSSLLSGITQVTSAIRATPDDLVAELAAGKSIDILLEGEQEGAARFERLVELAKTPDLPRNVAELLERMVDQVSSMLGVLRDARWELMAIRAERSDVPVPLEPINIAQLRDALDTD